VRALSKAGKVRSEGITPPRLPREIGPVGRPSAGVGQVRGWSRATVSPALISKAAGARNSAAPAVTRSLFRRSRKRQTEAGTRARL
jgi:hypothetical protein